MATLRELVDEVSLMLEGYGLQQGRSAYVQGSVDDEQTTFVVNDASNIGEGIAELGDEMIYILNVDGESNTVTLAPDGRGYMGSVADDHDPNTRLTMSPIFPRNLIKRKINECVVGLYPDLWGEAETEFTWNTIWITFELPSEVEDIVEVRFKEIIPTNEWPVIHHWELNRHADPDTFPTGVSIDIRDHRLYAGHTIKVVYRHAPTEFTDMDTEIIDTGLENSARATIVYGAAERLVRGMDPSRLPVATSDVGEEVDQNPIGTAVQVATFLRRHYEQELADEKRRQDTRTPAMITYTGSYL